MDTGIVLTVRSAACHFRSRLNGTYILWSANSAPAAGPGPEWFSEPVTAFGPGSRPNNRPLGLRSQHRAVDLEGGRASIAAACVRGGVTDGCSG